MKKKYKLLVITPVDHIKNLKYKLTNFFDVDFFEYIDEDKLLSKISNYDCIFTNPNQTKFFLGKRILSKAKKLKAIATASTGTNHVDINLLKKINIKLISLTKEFKIIKNIPSTAELALTLTLMAIRKVIKSNDSVKKNIWNYTNFIGREFSSLNILIIGYGRLGKIYAKLCYSLGFKIYIYDPYINAVSKKYKVINKLGSNLKDIDIISFHIHSNDANKNFVNKKFLSKFNKFISIINTSRGDIINEEDLFNFLSKNDNAQYYTDVLKNEHKGIKDNKIKILSKHNNNIFITSHIGGMTQEGQFKAYNHTADLLINYFKLNY